VIRRLSGFLREAFFFSTLPRLHLLDTVHAVDMAIGP
jgi:hypothetical protein